MADNWEIFVRVHIDTRMEVVLNTPLYSLIATNFPIQFITKLSSTVHNSANNTTRKSAAAMIEDVAGNIGFREALKSPTLTAETIDLLRIRAINFMLDEIISVQECGKVLASKLLLWSLELDVDWREFLRLARWVFWADPEYGTKSLIIDIICDQPQEFATSFISLLEPSIRENYSIFFTTMIDLLGEGNDHRPYRILTFVCGLLTHDQWSTLMEVAIMSSFFNRAHSSWNRVTAASCLRFCIDNGPESHYEHHTICKLHTIIDGLRMSRERMEILVAVELYEAVCRRILNVPILRRHYV